jgi:4-amino-4-deoxy-L-arabinose transferase-like glycosyltransferase
VGLRGLVQSGAMHDAAFEARSSRIAIAAAAVSFLVLLLFLPSFYATPDEAKYLGLGLNILDGNGLVTDFGARFLNHSPLWPLLMALPERLFGVSGYAVGHVLNAICGAVVVALTGVLAWRVRPYAGAVAAAAMLGVGYLWELSRTAGLDLPATAFTMAFTWTALVALDRGSARLGLLAGVLMGVGFLFKETALPFLPAPFLVAALAAVALPVMIRVAAATLGAAAVTMSWWFGLHAALGGTVYRLGTPAWTLVPLVVALVVFVLAGWQSERLAASPRITGAVARLPGGLRDRWRPLVAWGGLATWFVVQYVIYARTPKLQGASLIRPAQLVADLGEYGPQLAVPVAFGLVGLALALALVRRNQGVRELLFGFVAGIPLLLLVLAIGETPRHYVTSIALLVALGAAGWVAAGEAALRDRRRAVLLAVGVLVAVGIAVVRQHAVNRVGVAIGLGVAVAGAVVVFLVARRDIGRRGVTRAVAGTLIVVGFAALPMGAWPAASRTVSAEQARRQAVGELTAWVEANVPAGGTIAISPALAYEVAVTVRDDHRTVRFRPTVATGDPSGPFGLVARGRVPIKVPLTISASLRNVDQLDVLVQSGLEAQLRKVRPTAWIQAVYLPDGEDTTPELALLDATPGFTRVDDWSHPLVGSRLLVVAYTVDVSAVSFDGSRTLADAAGLTDLKGILESMKATSAAAPLADRITLAPDTPDARAALDALRSIGGAPSP